MFATLPAMPRVGDRGCCGEPGTGVFRSANPSASSNSSWRSASKELSCPLAGS